MRFEWPISQLAEDTQRYGSGLWIVAIEPSFSVESLIEKFAFEQLDDVIRVLVAAAFVSFSLSIGCNPPCIFSQF